MAKNNENLLYLGDAVYAEYVGGGVWLRTGDHRDAFCEDKIFIDTQVLENLITFVAHCNVKENEESVF